MRFVLEINCDNAAFGGGDDIQYRQDEVAAILEDVSELLRDGVVQYKILFDVNGNAVGTCEFKGEK